ncbi:response regulator [Spirosoma sp. HMF4905]|uniref:Response regulator n=1 Tax=Spirosoma arboris TaxID=2682092 RepID=A0A7K1SFL5_9BACT|nr:response regulator [Spirosoma arboris]MVM32498.1 response regulator [Spirosoma arboris]
MKKMYNILVVDDDPDDQLFIRMAFERVSVRYRIQLASNGLEGLGCIENNPVLPELILLDLNMPFLDGFEMLDHLKGSSRYRHVPIVILTTSDHQEDIDKAYALGANSFLTKPSDFDGLNALAQNLHVYWFETVQTPSPLPSILDEIIN